MKRSFGRAEEQIIGILKEHKADVSAAASASCRRR